MEIDTPYATKLFFPTSAFVQVYFEAVANAFDAQASVVSIRIVEDPLEVTITDNGIGLTEERFERFARLTEPADNYHKGLGRLVYLKYFSSVHVASVFDNKRRSFTFSNAFKGKSPTTDASPSEQRGTRLLFSGFSGERLQTKEVIKPANLKAMLLEQFLPLLHNKNKSGQTFRIAIELIPKRSKTQESFFANSDSLTNDDVPALNCKKIQDQTLDAFAPIFMSYTLLPRKAKRERLQLAAACVDLRTIRLNLLSPGAIPPDYSAVFLFESELFTGKSDSARQRLVLPETIQEAVLYRVLRREMSSVLNEKLPEIGQRNAETRQRFEEKYPHLTGLFDEETVGLVDKDEALDSAQRLFFKKQKDVLDSDSLDEATFEKSLEISSRALTEYILYRDFTIKRLKAVRPEDHESVAHNLVVPRRKQYDGNNLADGVYSNNAWLLDDRFMSFRNILSDFRMQDVIATIVKGETVVDEGRPDIAMIFSADPAVEESFDVVVVEFKRRGVDHRDSSYVTRQLAQRARRLATYWPNIQRAWYFAIVDIDDDLANTLETENWIPMYSKGRIFYQEYNPRRRDGSKLPTPVYVLSYDTIISDAEARNHTFLELLKSDFKKASSKKG